MFDSYNRDPGQWGDNDNNLNRYGIAEIPFVRRGDSGYVIVQGASWAEAVNAVALGGNLVTVNDAEENKWIVSNFSDQLAKPDLNWGGLRSGAWIGLNDIGSDGTPTWSSSSASIYRNYGLPDQHLGVTDRGDGWLVLMQDPSGEAEKRGRSLEHGGITPLMGLI